MSAVTIHSFPPISDAHARVLVLGSMPGKLSLEKREYYAHPRNLFWRMMEEVAGVSASLPYEARCTQLKAQRIAVWDTLKACTRTSSLDSDIDNSTIVPNAFAPFLAQHPHIRLIAFNGAKSEQVFVKQVAPELAEALRDVTLVRLPSTSPANASISMDVKLAQWGRLSPMT